MRFERSLWFCGILALAYVVAFVSCCVALTLGGDATLIIFWFVTAFLLLHAGVSSLRWLSLMERSDAVRACENDPDQIWIYIANLNSTALSERKRALQTLADYWGHPFGRIECWPENALSDNDLDWQRVLRSYRVLAEELTQDPLESKDTVECEPRRLEEEKTEKLDTVKEKIEERDESKNSYLDTLAERVKNAMLDLELPNEDPPTEDSPLPPLSKPSFLDAARVKFDRVLDPLADALGEETTIDEVLRNRADVALLFTDLGNQLLELSLDQRLEACAPAPARPLPSARRARCKRIRDIRLPDHPNGQGGWVEKFRRMQSPKT